MCRSAGQECNLLLFVVFGRKYAKVNMTFAYFHAWFLTAETEISYSCTIGTCAEKGILYHPLGLTIVPHQHFSCPHSNLRAGHPLLHEHALPQCTRLNKTHKSKIHTTSMNHTSSTMIRLWLILLLFHNFYDLKHHSHLFFVCLFVVSSKNSFFFLFGSQKRLKKKFKWGATIDSSLRFHFSLLSTQRDVRTILQSTGPTSLRLSQPLKSNPSVLLEGVKMVSGCKAYSQRERDNDDVGSILGGNIDQWYWPMVYHWAWQDPKPPGVDWCGRLVSSVVNSIGQVVTSISDIDQWSIIGHGKFRCPLDYTQWIDVAICDWIMQER